jgi:hypothetical protein
MMTRARSLIALSACIHPENHSASHGVNAASMPATQRVPFLDSSFAANLAFTRRRHKNIRRSNFALRLQPSLLDEARKLADEEGIALNQLINVAVAEKLSVLRTETYTARARTPHSPLFLGSLTLEFRRLIPPRPFGGRLAQRESTPFTRVGS